MRENPSWVPIGVYRTAPLPIRPVPPVPKPAYTLKGRRSILTWIPEGGGVKEHVTGTRWRI